MKLTQQNFWIASVLSLVGVVAQASVANSYTRVYGPVDYRRPSYSHGPGVRLVRGPGWHEGRWTHDRHGGRLGWWWVVGPSWHYYDRPYYEPRTVVIEQSAPAPQVVMVPTAQPPAPVMMMAPPVPVQNPVMYYCRNTGTYYPETMTCPGGWSAVTAQTPPAP